MGRWAKSVIVVTTGVLSALACYFSPYNQHTHWVQSCLWWFLCCFILPIGVAVALGFPLTELGLTIGDWLWNAIFVFAGLAVMIGFGFWAANQPDFQAYYLPIAIQHRSAPLVFWLSLFAYMLGWEFLFRGFLLFGLSGIPKRKELFPSDLKAWYAISLSTLLFGLSHFGKPLPEFIGSFIAGIALCLIAWRTRSCFAPILLHTFVFGLFTVLVQSKYLSILPTSQGWC